MKKPIIGIVGRYVESERKSIAVMEGYRKTVISAGGIPISILPTQNVEFSLDKEVQILDMTDKEKEDLILQINLCDGIIIPGGSRIFEYDMFICKYALDNNIPIIGICLGMQTMAIVDCNKSKVLTRIDNGVDHRIEEKFVHKVTLNKDSFLYNIVENETFKVNSFHKCHVLRTNKFDVVRIFRRWNC